MKTKINAEVPKDKLNLYLIYSTLFFYNDKLMRHFL